MVDKMNMEGTTYTKILDKFAKLQYNPKTDKKDFENYTEMKKVYTDHDVRWGLYFKDLEKAMSLAICETIASDIIILEEMEKQTDSLHDAISNLKEIKEMLNRG